MTVSRNADELLYQIEAQKLGHEVTPKESDTSEKEASNPDSLDNPDKLERPDRPDNAADTNEESKNLKSSDSPVHSEPEVSESKLQDFTPTSSTKDEYGNELPPPRTYTEDEVQRMIRDRLSRGRHAESQPYHQQQAIQQATQNFTPDPESNENWEVQLEKFVENTIQKVSQKHQTEQYQARERQVQADFEAKFTSGMTRYKDFNEVVANKPITDAMMLASRGMKDPAAFLYAAAKHHGKELERIASLPDPYQQGAEIGKLEATMRKSRAVTGASRPLAKTQGDMGGKGEVKLSVDDKIRQHAKMKNR